jgi:predicted nucleic acid-binding protein
MSRFVLDCSMTMAWCFEDEADLRAESVLASLAANEAVVPGIWPLEVANVLAVYERQRRITAAEIAVFLEMLKGLPIGIDDRTVDNAFGNVLMLARTHQITAYDAAYLELALRTGCSLASLDATLNGTATGLGIKLFDG